MEAIVFAGKSIARKIRRARLEDVLGTAGGENVHGEAQQKLDVMADRILLHALRAHPAVAAYASEEQGEPVVLRPGSAGGEFTVIADPLDGSSNIDVAVSVGTIFGVVRNVEPDDSTARSTLQPGARQVAAGYVLYGSSVVLVLTAGRGVDLFVLDPDLGEWLLAKEGLRMPEDKTYSINEAYWNEFDEPVRKYLSFAPRAATGAATSARWWRTCTARC